jgi:hypothetical protein
LPKRCNVDSQHSRHLPRYAALPNKAINSGRMVARFVEWHLAGRAQPLSITMKDTDALINKTIWFNALLFVQK